MKKGNGGRFDFEDEDIEEMQEDLPTRQDVAEKYRKLQEDIEVVEKTRVRYSIKFEKEHKDMIKSAKAVLKRVNPQELDMQDYAELMQASEDIAEMRNDIEDIARELDAEDAETAKMIGKPARVFTNIGAAAIAGLPMGVQKLGSILGGILKKGGKVLFKASAKASMPLNEFMADKIGEAMGADSFGSKALATTKAIAGGIGAVAVALPIVAVGGVLKLTGEVLRLTTKYIGMPFTKAARALLKVGDPEMERQMAEWEAGL